MVYLADDDLLADGLFYTLADVFESQPELDVVSGGVAIFRGDDISNIVKIVYPEFSYRGLVLHSAYESSRFVRRKVIHKVGVLDERYGFAAHREWLLRMLVQRLNFTYVKRICYYAREHELSGSLKSDVFKHLAFTIDHLDIWRRYLTVHSKKLDESAQAIIRQRAYRDALWGTRLALKKRDYKLALRHVKYGTLIFPHFPLTLLKHGAKSLGRRTIERLQNRQKAKKVLP
ncbi:MAG: hypothetical protein RMJ30_04370 [Nitrososphaerota archaeon]|nr:hypothetical protein [Nitrososphaerota archaeon]